MTGNIQGASRPTLLVTGASGFLGWHICRAASASWNVVGTYCSHETSIKGAVMHRLDLCSPDLRESLNALEPAAVIHAAAFPQPNACEQAPEQSEAVNVTATRNVARYCGERGIPLIYTSTDLVFDGLHAPYTEDDEPCPVSVYGRHKAEAEQAVLALAPKGAVCRLPLMFGDRDGAPASFIGPWIDTLINREPLTLFVDEFRTPVSGSSAAQGLMLALAAGVTGILHLGGPERISRHAFGLKLAAVFGLSADTIRPSRLAEVQMAAARPPDVSLDSSEAFALGYEPGTIDEQLEAVRLSMMNNTAQGAP
jgi:dTDP-4-dehydrorhamnose reductase